MGFMTFILEISSLSIFDRNSGYAYGVAYLFWGFFLFPMWIVYLSVVLGREHEDPNAPPMTTSKNNVQLLETHP